MKRNLLLEAELKILAMHSKYQEADKLRREGDKLYKEAVALREQSWQELIDSKRLEKETL